MKTLASRLTAAVVALFLCTFGLAWTAWTNQNSLGTLLGELYGTHLVAVRELKVISDRYAVDVVDAAHKARNGGFTFEEAAKAVTTAIEEIDTLWPKVRDGEKAAEARAIVADADAKLRMAGEASRTILALLKAGDKAGLERYIVDKMYPMIDPGTEQVGKLIDYHLAHGRADFEGSAADRAQAQRVLLAVAGLAMVLSAGALAYLAFGVSRPLRRSVETLGVLANGDLETSIAGDTRSDEIGDIARAMLRFRDSGLERRRLQQEAERETAERLARTARVEAIVREFEDSTIGIISTVASAAHELEASAKSMMDVAHTTSEQSTTVAAAAQETAQTVQVLANTGDELASSISEIGRQAEQGSHFAATAAHKARSTDATVKKLSEAGRAIVEVVDLIKSIAGQTNLLALNATIEAARAGESGRGFAVVASEVKELAAQTSRATDVIAEHVRAIQEASGESIDAMEEITRVIEEINQVASSIAVAVTEQSAATQGIADNVSQLAQGSEHAAQGIAVVNRAAAETGTSANQVLDASGELSVQAQKMREKVDWFLHAVRAA